MTDSTHWPKPEPRSGALCGADVLPSAILSEDSNPEPSCNGCRLIRAFGGSDAWIAIFDAYDADGPDHDCTKTFVRKRTVCSKQGLACQTCTMVFCEEHYDAHSCLKVVKRLYLNWILKKND